MYRSLRVYCGAIFTLLLTATNAHAVFISQDLSAQGDGLLTFDSNSHLRWLDITATSGMSYDFVSGQLGSGGQFEGFRYATLVEFRSFLIDGGVSDVGTVTSTSPQRWDEINGLLGYVGINESDYRHIRSSGFVSDIWSSSGGVDIYYAPQISVWTDPFQSQVVFEAAYASDTQSFNIGSWLVTDRPGRATAVPLPSTIFLFGMGLVAIYSLKRRRVL